MKKIKSVSDLWRRIPLSFKQQFAFVLIIFVIAISMLVLLYPRQKTSSETIKPMTTVKPEVYQGGVYPLYTNIKFYAVGNHTSILYEGWSFSEIPVAVGKYDLVIDHYGFTQDFYDIEIAEKPDMLRLNLPYGSLQINVSLQGEAADVVMEVFLPSDRINPVFVGSSSEKVVLPPGEYDIRFIWKGMEDWLEGIYLNNGDNFVKDHQMKIQGV